LIRWVARRFSWSFFENHEKIKKNILTVTWRGPHHRLLEVAVTWPLSLSAPEYRTTWPAAGLSLSACAHQLDGNGLRRPMVPSAGRVRASSSGAVGRPDSPFSSLFLLSRVPYRAAAWRDVVCV
jgi:hypothetical protein